jgi:prepilin-type processing-associated H-X9-DG protein
VPLPSPSGVPENTVYVCPDDDTARRSYAMNLWASSKVDAGYHTPPVQGYLWGPNAKSAARLVLLVEAWSYKGSSGTGFLAPPTVGSWGDFGHRFGGGGGLPLFPAGRFGMVNCELTYARHRKWLGPGTKTQPRGRIAIAFADGHVELLASDSIVDYQTGALMDRCFWSPLDLR